MPNDVGKTDIRIIEMLIQAGGSDEYPLLRAVLPELMHLRDNLNGGDEGEFANWIKGHPAIHSEVANAVGMRTVEFVESRIDALTERKAAGGLSEEEKAIAKSILSSLLESVDRLFPPEDTDREKPISPDEG